MKAGNGAALASLGVTQIASWGPLYYAFSVLMKPMQAELGWSRDLLVGGHAVAMALCLYEAAFTVLTIAYRERSRWAITVLTLAGGFASTVFWPVTQMLVDAFGWRDAVLWLAAIQFVLCLPLHAFVLPGATKVVATAPVAERKTAGHVWLHSPAFWLLAVSFTANSFVTAAISVHVIALLGERGLAASDAVWLGALIGPMQFSGRLMEFLFGKRLSATGVGTVTVLLLPASLVMLMVAGASVPVLLAFVLLYGAGLGLYTIVRATTPAELFGRDDFGALNGALAAPSSCSRARPVRSARRSS